MPRHRKETKTQYCRNKTHDLARPETISEKDGIKLVRLICLVCQGEVAVP